MYILSFHSMCHNLPFYSFSEFWAIFKPLSSLADSFPCLVFFSVYVLMVELHALVGSFWILVNLFISENKSLIVYVGGSFNCIKYSSPSKCTRHEGFPQHSGLYWSCSEEGNTNLIWSDYHYLSFTHYFTCPHVGDIYQGNSVGQE